MKLFGTDGVRGVAGEFLTEELARALGKAVVETSGVGQPQAVIVRDTRESGPTLERALAEGMAAAGCDVFLAGVLPTPAASILVRRLGLDLAAVVSASHNPWQDNGIKFFGSTGSKLPDERADQIEERVRAELARGAQTAGGDGSVADLEGGQDDYLRALSVAFRLDLGGRRIALDCANGSTHAVAPEIFRRLGAEVDTIGTQPDGRNINADCGSTHPERLAELVRASGAALGFAFDGDGDRVVAVDGAGVVRDGDELITLIAQHLHATGELDGGVAVTVMSNLGLHRALAKSGIEVATTAVGDRHVAAELERRSWTLGGEQSGHLIWTDFAPTGDGIATALLALRALGETELASARPMERLPQVLKNVEVADRDAIAGAAELWSTVEHENEALAGSGRVLVRPSGTEPLLRVMVEAPTSAAAEEVCARVVAVVERELG